MLLSSGLALLDELEHNERITTRRGLLARLRPLGLDDLGRLLIGMPDPRFPRLSALLPSMASEAVQRNWTGNHGEALLVQTNTFVRFLATSYATLTRRDIRHAEVLDFGCGYGRVIRSMYYHVDPERISGVDPWELSIRECLAHGIASNIAQSDYLPTSLPVGGRRFDLVYAFSVFTHLSLRATQCALDTLRNCIEPDGVLVITLRPPEYWDVDPNITADLKQRMVEQHRSQGFAFAPHHREAVDGDITYGDTSMSTDWLVRQFPEWKVEVQDRPLIDPYQIYLALRPA